MDVARENRGKMLNVNRQLLPVKGIYFFFLAAIGALLPYMTVYMKHLGLTPRESGIIYGSMPFISFFVRPVFGAIADKLKKHKLVLIICILCTGVFYCMLLLTPKQEIQRSTIVTSLECSNYDSYISDCSAVITGDDSRVTTCPAKLRLPDFADQYVKGDNSSNIPCEFSCSKTLPMNEEVKVCLTNEMNIDDDCKTWNSGSNDMFVFTVNLQTLLRDKIIPTNFSNKVATCDDFDLKNISHQRDTFWHVLCDVEALLDCEITCKDYPTACEHGTFGQTFWVFLVIFLFANVAFSPVLSLVDAIVYDMLGEKRGHWGMQRLWGTVGFAIFAIGSGAVTYQISVNFVISFLLFLGLTLLSSIVTCFLKFSETIHCAPVFQNTLLLLKSFKIVVFFVLMTCFGIMNAVTEAFLAWYVMLLGGNTLTIGLCLIANCLPEIFLLLFSGKIIKKIGHMTCFSLGLLAYVIRFLLFSVISDPWLIVPVELLHCLCFALMYAAASGYASMIAPEGTMATMQGLIGGLYFGFGKGIGSIVTGALFDSATGIGPVWTFRVYAFFALVLFILYTLLCALVFRNTGSKLKTEIHMKPRNSADGDGRAVGELLLGANSINNDNADV